MPAPADAFDPYFAWLGIPPDQRPLNHYQLLGLARFEADAQKITAAADERMGRVRQYQQGPRSVWSQRVLNELAAARVCLLNPAAKASYDAWLTAMAPTAAPRSSAAPLARVLGVAPGAAPPVVRVLNPPVAPPIAAPPLPAKSAEEGSSPGLPWGLVGLVVLGVLLIAAPVAWWLRTPKAAAPKMITELPDSTEETDPTDPPIEMTDETPSLKSAVLLQQEADGAVNFTPATAALAGGVELAVEGTDNVLTNWAAPDDRIRWRFRLLEPSIFQVHVIYSADGTVAGGRIAVTIGDEEKLVTIRIPDNPGETVTDSFYLKIPNSGEHVLTLRGLDRVGKEYCTVRSVRIVPK